MYLNLSLNELEREYNPASNIPYGTGPLEAFDLFFAGRGKAPLQIFFHGGSWKGQDKANYSFLAEPLVAVNVISINVNYDLRPNVTMSQLLDECRKAVLFVWTHARLMGGDPNRITVCGHSAGSHIAARMIETDWSAYNAPKNLIKGGVLISGLYDLEPIGLTSTNKSVQLSADDVKKESPMFRTPQQKMPLFLSCGTNDNSEFCRQTRDYAHHLREHSFPITYVKAKGHNHFTILEALGDTKDTLGRAMVDMALGRMHPQ